MEVQQHKVLDHQHHPKPGCRLKELPEPNEEPLQGQLTVN